MSNQLFRKQALDTLALPDQLDQLIRITNAKTTWAIVTLLSLVGVFLVWAWTATLPVDVVGRGVLLRPDGIITVSAPSAGVVQDILVHAGDEVTPGQGLVRIRTGRGVITEIRSSHAGLVREVLVGRGDAQTQGEPLLTLELPNSQLTAVLYLPIDDGRQLRVGQEVLLSPATSQPEEDGFLRGKVAVVAQSAATRRSMQALVQDDALVERFYGSGPVLQAMVFPVSDPQTPSGFQWTLPPGPQLPLTSGVPCTGRVVVGARKPIGFLLPNQ